MRWPGSRDYNEAVQDPSYSFKDAGLQVAEATVNAHGLPVARSGGFADVYQLRTPTGECWAVKCFTREVTELRRRYQAISDHLSAARESGGLRFMVDFQYLDEEIRVGPERYPAVKMTWVEGKLLHEFVREHADDPVVLTKLTGIWHKLGQNLRAAGMAHGDLQHGNVILVPSAKGVIPQLIDYDGMYVPALEGIPASEIGHANYQHPGRNADRFHLEIDRFPLLLVYTAVRCLATGGRALWNRFDSGDNLLFKESDIKNPAGSALFRELWSSPDPEVRALAGWVILASRMPLRKVPLLDEIIGPDGKQTPALTGLQEAEVRRLMTATQPVASEPKPVPRKSTPVSVTRPGTQPAPVTPAKKTTPAPLPLDADGSKSWLKSLTNAQRLGLLAGGLGALLVISSIIAAVMNSPRSSSGVGTAAIAQGGSADRGQSTMTPSPPKVATKSSEKSPAPSLAKQLVMTGHTDKVATVAISADGKRAISGGYDNAVIVWNLETGKEIQRLTGHKNWVFGVGISADGKRAVSGGYDNAVIVWNLETGKEIRRLTGPTQPVWSVSITPDGKRAISGGQDKALFVWDLETGQELQRLTGHQLTVYAVGISADGKRAVSAGEEKAVFVWNLETGKEIQRLTGHTFAIRAVGISADGKRAVSGAQDSTTSAWNLESGKEIQRFGHESTVRGVAISADGRRVVSSGHDKDVVMWDLETGKEIGRFDRNSDVVSSVAISADGKRVVFGSEDKTVRMWNGPEFVDSAKPVAPTPTPTPIAVQLTANGVSLKTGETKVLDVQIDRNGRTEPLVIHLTGLPAGVTAKPVPIPGATNAVRFALTAAESAPACNVIVRLQARSNGEEINDPLDIAVQVEEAPPVPTVPGQPIILAGHTDTIHTLGISGDGKRAISGGKDMTVRIWNPETRKELHRLTDHKSAIHRVAISADGTRAVSCDEGGFGVVWDAVVGKQLFQIKDVGHIRSVAISADGKRVVFGTTLFGPPVEYLVRIWDLENARELHRLGGHTQSVEHVAITPDGKRAVSSDSGEDRIVRVWDTDKGREISRFTKHPDPVAQVGISADGKRAISRGQYGGVVRVWDTEKGKEISQLDGQGKDIPQFQTYILQSMNITPDGKQVISGCSDGFIRVWDADKGEELFRLTRNIGSIDHIASSSDGKRILSPSAGIAVRVWDTTSDRAFYRLGRHTETVRCVAYSADGTRGISGSRDRTVRVFDTEAGKELLQFSKHMAGVYGVGLSADGSRAISGDADGMIYVWETEKGKELYRLTGHKDIVFGVGISSEGKRAVSCGQDSTVRVWNLETGKEQHRLTGHTGSVLCVSISGDGTQAISGGSDATMRLWNLETGKEVRRFTGHTESVNCVAISTDGKRAVSGSKDQSVRLWDLETGKEIRQVNFHGDAVLGVAISGDGSRVVSSGAEGGVRYTELRLAGNMRSLEGHSGGVYGVGISSDGKKAITGGADKLVLMWRIP